MLLAFLLFQDSVSDINFLDLQRPYFGDDEERNKEEIVRWRAEIDASIMYVPFGSRWIRNQETVLWVM